MFLGMILSFKIFSKGIVDHNRIIDVGKINQNHLLPRNMRTFFDFFTLLKPTEKRSWAGFELAFGNTGPPLYIPFSGGNLHLFTFQETVGSHLKSKKKRTRKLLCRSLQTSATVQTYLPSLKWKYRAVAIGIRSIKSLFTSDCKHIIVSKRARDRRLACLTPWQFPIYWLWTAKVV